MIGSVTRVVSKASNLGQSHGYRTKTPKTRFTVNQKPIASPRLKSFPAEKIKKIENPVQSSSEFVHPVNSGQGDVLPDSQQLANQNATASDQLIPRNVHPVDTHVNHSEPAIAYKKENISVDQPHRPSVPEPQQIQSCGTVQHQPKQIYQQNIPGPALQQSSHDYQKPNQFAQPAVQNAHSQGPNFHQGLNSQQLHQNELRRQAAQPQNYVRQDQAAEAKKKVLKFTPAMIKDQEMLVMTMKQQGIKEDVMRRQFEALMAEQRRQLLYMEQLKNPQNTEPENIPAQRVHRKVSKIMEDGKPEWMLHITPPRIPYNVIEQMQEDRRFESPKVSNEGNPGIPSCCQNENCTRNIYSHPWQLNSANVWQQQPPNYHHQQHQQVPNNIPNGNHQQHFQMANNIRNGNHQQHFQMANNIPNGNQSQQFHAPTNITNGNQHQHFQTPNNIPNGHQEVHHRHPGHYQQQPNKGEPQMTSELKPIEESPRSNRVVEPSSLLKLRLYKEVIRRQKQNNGLQDPEMIKEAMDALKDPANRKGLEYLDNLNKKREKPVVLNGVQDPQETALMNHEMHVCQQPKPKVVPANGLENRRNPNNPMPPRLSALMKKKMDAFAMSEYPKQRTTPRNCYTVTAERENGTVASNNQIQNPYGVQQTHQQIACSHQQQRDHPNYSYPGHHSEVIHENKPVNNIQNSAPRNDFHHAGHSHSENPHSTHPHERQHGFHGGEMMANNQRQGCFDSNKICLYEPVIIGGVQYLARKPEYSQTPLSQHYSHNHGNGFNSAVVCQ